MGDFRVRDPVADRLMADTPSLLRYLPHLLRYPVSGHALPVAVTFAFLLWMGLQSIMGIALLAIVAPWVFHYAEGVIQRTALGQATPPAFGGNMIFIGGLSTLRPLVGIAPLVAGLALTRDRAWEPIAIATFGVLWFPSFMLLLAVHGNLATALNPLRWVQVMVAVGPAYFGVCGVLAACAALAIAGASQAGTGLALLVLILGWIFVCHLLGFVAYHHAEALGLATHLRVTRDERQTQEQQSARLAEVLGRIDRALNERNLQAAADALHTLSGEGLDPLRFHEALFEQMQRRKIPELLHAQGERLIRVLLEGKRIDRALDVAEICFDAHPDFSTPDVVQLAGPARRSNRGLFERLVKDAARYPREVAVSLEFLSAQYSAEQQRDEARAREILQRLSAEAAHPQHRQILAYARALAVR